MADGSLIEWTDATWNPVTGCKVVSPGCTNCYAMKLAGTRLRDHPSRKSLTVETKAGPVWNGRVRRNGIWMPLPIRWRKPRRVFVCAHGDLFYEEVREDWIDEIFAIMALSPQHDFQVLTKRSARMRAYMNDPEVGRRVWREAARIVTQVLRLPPSHPGAAYIAAGEDAAPWPLPNVWLGVSAEDQPRADERVVDLMASPAAVRFVSVEPMVGPVEVTWALSRNRLEIAAGFLHRGHFSPGLETLRPLDWVIVGGESGSSARPMHPRWARQLRDACEAAGVAFFFKQWGAWAPREEWVPGPSSQRAIALDGSPVADDVAPEDVFGQRFELVGKSEAGRILDGATWSQFPEVRA